MVERLQKYMAKSGIASRRNCEIIIKQGRVKVNGVTVSNMGVKINPNLDQVMVDGRIITPKSKMVYIILNKPSGYITSVTDPQKRPTVLDLIDEDVGRIYPVGRLDFESEGLLMLTNDGEMTYYLTHPKYEVKKQYRVLVAGHPGDDKINSLRRGVDIGNYITRPCELVKIGEDDTNSMFNISIHEGKNRQIRRMFDTVGHSVINLRRERLGNLTLGSLKLGTWRYLYDKEIEDLKKYIYKQ